MNSLDPPLPITKLLCGEPSVSWTRLLGVSNLMLVVFVPAVPIFVTPNNQQWKHMTTWCITVMTPLHYAFSPKIRLYVQHFVKASKNENIKSPHYGSFWGVSTRNRWPPHKWPATQSVFMEYHNHDKYFKWQCIYWTQRWSLFYLQLYRHPGHGQTQW